MPLRLTVASYEFKQKSIVPAFPPDMGLKMNYGRKRIDLSVQRPKPRRISMDN